MIRALVLLLCSWPAEAQPEATMRQYLERVAAEQLAARRAEVGELRTKEDWDRRRAAVRGKFLSMMGGLPSGRSPLRARTTGTLDRGDYRVEKIVFESLPGLPVTANLYIPQTGRPPYPAVLHPTGHSTAAKNRPFYQTLSIGLAKQGFVTLTYDPIGQGERRIFYDPAFGDSTLGSTTVEHTMLGIRNLLAGESIARYMIWDAMRGLDLLESRPEVDRTRLGVTGCSGGGTLTVYLAALDPRIRAAAPACYVTSWEEQLPGTGPQDAEQQFPDQFRAGINHADLLALAAPTPYLICSSTEDFFPLEGARRTVAEARTVWQAYGAADRLEWFSEPGGHGIYRAGRERVYAWMRRWLRGEDGAIRPEPPIQVEVEQDLNSTATGQMERSAEWNSGVPAITRPYAKLAPERPALSAASLAGFRNALERRVREATRYEPSAAPLDARSGEPQPGPVYRVERLSFDTGHGPRTPALLVTPAAGANRTVLYVDSSGKEQGGKPRAEVVELAERGYTVLAIDVAGAGQLSKAWPGYADQWFGQEKMSWLALMTGRPVVGLQMGGILRAIDVLAARALVPAEGVLAVGRGPAAVAMLHAAAVDRRIGRLVLEDMLVSYRAVAAAPVHRRVFETVIPGVLRAYDLPDLVAAVAPRPVTLVNLRTPAGGVVLRADGQAEYAYAGSAYRAAMRPAAFQIRLRSEEGKLLDLPDLGGAGPAR